jgi:hypothetical protein
MEGLEAPIVVVMVGSYWELFGIVSLWDWIAPEHSAGLCIGFAAGWDKTAVAPWGVIMVPLTSPWFWTFVWMGGIGMSVRETRNKLIPILCM